MIYVFGVVAKFNFCFLLSRLTLMVPVGCSMFPQKSYVFLATIELITITSTLHPV